MAEPVKTDNKADSKTSADKQEESYFPFHHRVQSLLRRKGNKGLFIGEIHTHPSISDTLVYLMPMLKAEGITTLSVELPPSMVKSISESKTIEEWRKMPDASRIHLPDKSYHLIHAAKKLGIEVIGHEAEDEYKEYNDHTNALLKKYFPDEMDAMEKALAAEKDADKRKALEKKLSTEVTKKVFGDKKIAAEFLEIYKEYHPEGSGGVKRRNIYAAQYINDHKAPGQVLVLGGAAHSKHNPQTQGLVKDGDGLDARLGIPAINYKFFGRGKMGHTTQVGKDTYDVILPPDLKSDLKKLGIASWPPLKGIPDVEADIKEFQKLIPMEPKGKAPSAYK